MHILRSMYGSISRMVVERKRAAQSGSASVEFIFAFLLLFWMCLGFVEAVFLGYNGLIVNYGSYMGSRGYLVDEPGGNHWKEGAERIGRATMRHTDIAAERSGSAITLSVTNKEMIRTGIIWGTAGDRTGTLSITTDLGRQEDSFAGDND